MNTLQTAQRWLQTNISVIPIVSGEKRPALSSWKQYQTQLPSADQTETWFSNGAGLAVVTGHQGLTVIDFDDRQVYQRWLAYGGKCPLAKQVARFTHQVKTAKGRHVYVYLPEATKSRPLLKPDGERWGIDIKSRGGYVLAPPSIHPSGRQYRAVNGQFIVGINALSEILPPEMLRRPDFEPKGTAPRPIVKKRDIWDEVMHPVEMGDGTIQRIKSHFRMEDLLPIEKRTGADFYLTRCPLHDDHDPSMWVNTRDQICGCYAGCTPKPLDVINLYARVHDLNNKAAIRELVSRMQL
jgi:hypothetical protein